MKIGKHTSFMIEFIKDFIDGEIDFYFFEMDYPAYVIEHFPHMENENPRLADRFADTIDYAYEHGANLGLTDQEFRAEISDAFDEWIGKTKRGLF
jgi:predicted ATPase